MNFFSIRTNDQNTIGKILEKVNQVVFDTLSWHKNEISIGDIVFIVISGDSSKKNHEYENGLRAIGKVVNLPKDEIDKKHFTLDVEIFEFLSKTLTKDDFYLFPSLKDAPNIGPDTKSAPNQAFRKIDNEIGKSIIRAIIDLSWDKLDISKYEMIVNNNFKIDKLKLDSKILNGNINSGSKYSNIIQEKFVEWFYKLENYKKSYEGLVNIKVLNFWNEGYFKKALFSINLNDIDSSLLSIENLISDKSNLDWKNYSEATSKGAPEAVLGKNNYLKFLTEFLTDKKNIELLKELSNSNFNNNILPETNFDINLFQEKLDNAGLIFSPQLIQRFIASLCTKPFVICSGLSGSGKTKLAQAFAQWICYKEEDGEKNEQYCIVPVGADWTNREPLLGYPNALKKEEYVSPENGVLDLMVRAKQNIENTEEPTKPYFLILDEMNLSHVERYFADFLSTMESGDTIPLHKILPESTKHLITIPQTLKLPKNLFIIGTVNIDETTYMFSPKVLDRANTIEFRLTEKNLEDFIASDIKLDMKLLKAQGANMSDSFMAMALQETDKNLKPSEADLKLFFSELKKSGAEFGYRTASEIGRLMYMLNELGESGDNLLDIAIMQKLLPKLHGSRNKLTKVLPILGGFCLTDNSKIKEDYLDKFVSNSLTEVELEADTNIKYKISFEKICRMYKNAVENGFASYAEA
jgi:hypothetical protein